MIICIRVPLTVIGDEGGEEKEAYVRNNGEKK